MNNVNITFIGKPECTLCDTAWKVLNGVLATFTEQQRQHITVEVKSILTEPVLHEKYWEEIPVLLINEKVHDYWRFTPRRLEPALLNALTA